MLQIVFILAPLYWLELKHDYWIALRMSMITIIIAVVGAALMA